MGSLSEVHPDVRRTAPFYFSSPIMGRPDSDPPSPSPMDRSSTSDCNEGQFQPPVAANNSRKKWIALGLSLCLILVLLIAVIVLATSKNTPPPCPNPQNIS